MRWISIDRIAMDYITLEQWEQRHKIFTRELVKYECDPKVQMWSKSWTDVVKNESCPTATSVRNPWFGCRTDGAVGQMSPNRKHNGKSPFIEVMQLYFCWIARPDIKLQWLDDICLTSHTKYSCVTSMNGDLPLCSRLLIARTDYRE